MSSRCSQCWSRSSPSFLHASDTWPSGVRNQLRLRRRHLSAVARTTAMSGECVNNGALSLTLSLHYRNYRRGISAIVLPSLITANNQRRFWAQPRAYFYELLCRYYEQTISPANTKKKCILIEHQSSCRNEEKVAELRGNSKEFYNYLLWIFYHNSRNATRLLYR